MELPTVAKQENKDLQQLLGLIKLQTSKQQLPHIKGDKNEGGTSRQWPLPQTKSGAGQTQSSEVFCLQQFSTKYHAERNFSQHPNHARFLELFKAVIKHRLCNSEWMSRASPENILRVLMCLRILMRDPEYQKHFFDLSGVKHLSDHFTKATASYLEYGDGPYVVDILKEMTNIFQKLSSIVEQQEWLIACGAHKSLVLLLSSNDVIVLHCSLLALVCLAQSSQPRLMIGELNCVEQLLRIIQEYDNVSKKHAARLLGLLCQDGQTRELVKQHDGVPILLSQLVSDNANMLCQVVWCLATLCVDTEISKDVRQTGGIPLLLSLLHQLVSDNANMLCQVVWCLATLCVDLEISKDVRQTGGIPLLLSLLQSFAYYTSKAEVYDVVDESDEFEYCKPEGCSALRSIQTRDHTCF